ncbi:MAG: hypothetical protein JW820_11210, partial [Spirochaetales bacterium]|nr:hypothetical protein [Spirochaetales bacterium]
LLVAGSIEEADGATILLRADPVRAAAVLERAAGSPELRRQLGRLGRQAAEERYDIDRVAAAWQSLMGEATVR